MTKPKKRALEDWPAIGLGPIVMQRQGSNAANRAAVLAWGADRIVQYTRATLDSTFLALHLELHQPTTIDMDELLADILAGRLKAKPRPKKKWLSPEALAVFKHWHDVRRAKLEEGDAGYTGVASSFGWSLDTKGQRNEAAWNMTALMFQLSRREAEKWYYSD